MSQIKSRRLFGGMLQVASIMLVLITASIHLQHGISMSAGGFGGGAPGGRPGAAGTPGAFPGGPGSGTPPAGRPGVTGTPGTFPGGSDGGAPGGSPGGSGFALLQWIPFPLSTLFILNGIGYLVLVVALYLPFLRRIQRLIRWLLIVFAAVTFTLYFLINGFHLDTISLVDKVAEIALIALLLIDEIRSARSGRSEVFHGTSSQPVLRS